MICVNFTDSNDAQEENFERRNIVDQEDEEYPQELDDEIAAYRKKLLKASENIEIAEDITAKRNWSMKKIQWRSIISNHPQKSTGTFRNFPIFTNFYLSLLFIFFFH